MFLHMYDLSLKGCTVLQERKTSRQTLGTQRILGLGHNKFEDGTMLLKTPLTLRGSWREHGHYKTVKERTGTALYGH